MALIIRTGWKQTAKDNFVGRRNQPTALGNFSPTMKNGSGCRTQLRQRRWTRNVGFKSSENLRRRGIRSARRVSFRTRTQHQLRAWRMASNYLRRLISHFYNILRQNISTSLPIHIWHIRAHIWKTMGDRKLLQPAHIFYRNQRTLSVREVYCRN